MHSSRMRTVRSSGRFSGEGGVCSGGASAPGEGGVCSHKGVSARGVGCVGCLLLGVSAPGVSAPEGGLSAPRGVSAPGGCLLWGVCSRGGGIPPCTEADTTPLWTDRRL